MRSARKPFGLVIVLLSMVLVARAFPADVTDPLMRVAGTRAYRPPAATVQTTPSIEIGKGGSKKIRAALFCPKVPAERPRPAVVFLHGGGWSGGGHYNTFGAWLAERGYVVASIGYRLSTEARWPAQIEDCRLDVRWLRANAARYHADPDHIGVFGTSAGGHLAACVGTMGDMAELEGTGGYAGVSSRVQAVAAFCPPTDFTGGWLNGGPMPAFVEALFGVRRDEKPELWRQASPALAARPGAPPFFIAHGKLDTHVPYWQGEKLARALKQCGNSVELVTVQHAGHDFFLNPTTPESTIQPNHEAIMARLLAFFDKHLKNTH